MKCLKKIPKSLFVIIPLVLIFTTIYSLYGSSLSIYIQNSRIKPIQELFTMDFANLNEPTIEDLSKCDSTRIIEERNEGMEKGKIKGDGKFTLENDCWRTYENDILKFSFRDFNDTVVVYKDSNEKVEILFKYTNENNKLKAGRFVISSESKINTGIATDFCNTNPFFALTEENKQELKNKIDLDKVTVNGRWNYYDILRNRQNCYIEFISLDSFVNGKGTRIDRSYYENIGSEPINNANYTVDLPGEDFYISLGGSDGYHAIDILSTIEIK